MTENIHILAISHAFTKKINTSLFWKIEHDHKVKVKLLCPAYVNNKYKKITPDFGKNQFKDKVYISETKFNHLRLKYYKMIPEILKKNKFNFIFLDADPISFQSIILIIFSFFYKFKLCYFSNENDLIISKNNFSIKKVVKNLILYFSYKIIYLKIYKIFCHTEQIKKNLQYIGLKKKLTVIPLGYDEKVFFKKNVDRKNPFIISYFGRISKNKGVHTLLKSLINLKINDWFFYLDIFEIEDLEYFKSIKKDLKYLKKIKKIKLIKCDHNNINEFMQKTDLTIVPSEWNEQYGRIIQESAACGSLVIGSKIGAIPEMLIDNKFMFEPKNYIELKNKIEDIISNKEFYKKEFEKIYSNIILNRSVTNQARLISEKLFSNS